MTWLDLVWFPPLMVAVAVVVGAAGRRRGEVRSGIRRAFVGLTLCIVVVGLLVRLVVELFA
jgi:hypothetical protein